MRKNKYNTPSERYSDRCVKREAVCRKLRLRYEQLDAVRRELHGLWERMRLEFHQAEDPLVADMAWRLYKQVERAEIRICRQMDKYDLWAARLEFWNIVHDNAYYRLHPWYE